MQDALPELNRCLMSPRGSESVLISVCATFVRFLASIAMIGDQAVTALEKSVTKLDYTRKSIYHIHKNDQDKSTELFGICRTRRRGLQV